MRCVLSRQDECVAGHGRVPGFLLLLRAPCELCIEGLAKPLPMGALCIGCSALPDRAPELPRPMLPPRDLRAPPVVATPRRLWDDLEVILRPEAEGV